MCKHCHHLSIPVLLLIIQFISPDTVQAQFKIPFVQGDVSQLSTVAKPSTCDYLISQATPPYEPPNNGGPDTTQGSGTR